MTLDGMGYPGDLPAPRSSAGRFDVRASRIDLRDAVERGVAIRSQLWVGGGDTAIGDPVGTADVAGAWIVDCADELPHELKSAAARWIPRVFEDIDQEPPDYPRTARLACLLAAAVAGEDAPPRVYVMCKQGFNRSGLLAGRILRELGVPPSLTLELIRSKRPGALSNLAFSRLVTA